MNDMPKNSDEFHHLQPTPESRTCKSAERSREILPQENRESLSFRLEIIDEAKISPALDSKIREHLTHCFLDSPEKFQIRRVWHNTKPEYTVLCVSGDDTPDHPLTVLGHIAVVIRTITTTWNWRYNVASIQGVSVAESHRRAGIAVRMIDLALQESQTRGYLYAILFCKEPLVPFYQKLGWRLTDDSVIMRNEQDCPIKMRSNCPMFKVLTETPFPEGPVDVHNPEQVGMARVAKPAD